jgi:hypothetical protein
MFTKNRVIALLVSSVFLCCMLGGSAQAYYLKEGPVFNRAMGIPGVDEEAPLYTDPGNLDPSYYDAGGVMPNDLEDAEPNTLVNRIQGAIQNAPSGSTIRIAMYSLNLPYMAREIIAAHNRGVNVQFITDDHDIDNTPLEAVQKVLNTKNTKYPNQKSFLFVCDGSCSSDYIGIRDRDGDPKTEGSETVKSYMHAKFLTFSQTGSSTYVTMITSSNITQTQVIEGYNNMFITVGKKGIYDFVNKKFDDMRRSDADTRDIYESAELDGKYKLYFFPREKTTTTEQDSDPFYGIFSNIKCTGVSEGYGGGGYTNISIAMFQWTRDRKYLADQLWALDNAGCNVRMVISRADTDRQILDVLLKPTKFGGIIVKDADVDVNPIEDEVPPNLERFSHHKYILVNGYYASDKGTMITFTGTANFSKMALRENNEITIKIDDDAVYKRYMLNFNFIYNNRSTQLTLSDFATQAILPMKETIFEDNMR